jgi:predicted aspartyl protease
MKGPRVDSRALRCVVVLLAWVACAGTHSAWATNCTVIHGGVPSDADKALMRAKFDEAATLYHADLAKQPGDVKATTGLVHALLREQKVQEAADAVTAALAVAPQSAGLVTLRGEVELRQGMPWQAAKSVAEAAKLDPCSPRNMMLAAHLNFLNSMYASERRQIVSAHLVSPDDPEIRQAWMGTLPLKQQIAELEAYLAGPHGEDADVMRVQAALDHMRKLDEEPVKPCRLVSTQTATEIPFARLMMDATHVRAFGLEVKLNNHGARLQIDTGAGGLLVTHAVAQKAGLKEAAQTQVGGIGDKGARAGYTAFADSIRIGNLEFQNCAVHVLSEGHVVDDVDGLIGMDVFSQFLVTLDYPMRKLVLGPLPPRPGEEMKAGPALKTSESGPGEAESGDAKAADAAASAAKPVSHGPYDRYVAPEMKDYWAVYRVGHDLIIPASLNAEKMKLFILDTGAWTTTISPEAAREVTKVHTDSDTRVHGISGEVKQVYSTGDITFRFANLEQKTLGVTAFDTSNISRGVGMEISGFIGATTLGQTTIHIDYRDGLVKFDYDPNRGYKFEGGR